ncbi:MAG: PKD domain-containing protein [Methylococcales bacterium]|nr:PKD domain-containing protein [Methylococcales bacterium]
MGGTNPLFNAATCEQVAADSTVPSNVPQPLDPANQLTAIVGGAYTGIVNVAITFDGTGSVDPGGEIVSYEWDFGDGSTGTGTITWIATIGDGDPDVIR